MTYEENLQSIAEETHKMWLNSPLGSDPFLSIARFVLEENAKSVQAALEVYTEGYRISQILIDRGLSPTKEQE